MSVGSKSSPHTGLQGRNGLQVFKVQSREIFSVEWYIPADSPVQTIDRGAVLNVHGDPRMTRAADSVYNPTPTPDTSHQEEHHEPSRLGFLSPSSPPSLVS